MAKAKRPAALPLSRALANTSKELFRSDTPEPLNEPRRIAALRSLYRSQFIIGMSSVPKGYISMTDKSWVSYTREHERELQDTQDAVVAGKSIVLTGDPGTGKTHLAMVALYAWWYRHVSFEYDGKFAKVSERFLRRENVPLFLPAVEMLSELKRSFTDGDTDRVSRSFREHPLLVLDDLGAGSPNVNDWQRQEMYTLVDRYYRDGRTIVVTTNLAMQQIAELYDDRLASRLSGMGVVIKCVGDDRRLQKK